MIPEETSRKARDLRRSVPLNRKAARSGNSHSSRARTVVVAPGLNRVGTSVLGLGDCFYPPAHPATRLRSPFVNAIRKNGMHTLAQVLVLKADSILHNHTPVCFPMSFLFRLRAEYSSKRGKCAVSEETDYETYLLSQVTGFQDTVMSR